MFQQWLSSIKSLSPIHTLPLLHPFFPTEQWKPIDPEDKKRYDREFLLGFRYIGASMNKPEGLPLICDVVLDKVNYTVLKERNNNLIWLFVLKFFL